MFFVFYLAPLSFIRTIPFPPLLPSQHKVLLAAAVCTKQGKGER